MASAKDPSSPSRTSPKDEVDAVVSVKSSQYKGVHWDKTKSKWVGYIHVHGKKHHLGYFAQEEDAARAYDRESLRCRGITKNFPSSEYESSDLSQEPEVRKVLEKSSRYIGVSWNKLRRKWAGRIIVDGRSLHLGHYTQEEDAARAYDKVCLKSRGSTKNFPAEQYASSTEVRNPPVAGEAAPAGRIFSSHHAPQFAMHHTQNSFGSGTLHRYDTDDNSQDSSTSIDTAKVLQEVQPRLFMNSSREYSAVASVPPEPLGFMHPSACIGQSAFNPYAGLSPLKPTVASTANWSQPSMTTAPPSQMLGYTSGLNSLLPLGPLTHNSHAQAPAPPQSCGGSGFFFSQTSQPTAIHSLTPYSALQPVIPSSLLGGQPLPLPPMLQMHPTGAPSISCVSQLTPGSNQISTPSGMAQLQAWAALQNSMYAAPSGMYSPDKQVDMHPPLKRQRFDTLVQ